MMEPSALEADVEQVVIARRPRSRKRSKSAEGRLYRTPRLISQLSYEELELGMADFLPQEHIRMYGPGGYMRVAIGQVVGPFTVVRKLGYGAFSTVWLGVDFAQKNKFVAIKIAKSELRSFNSIRAEMAILDRIGATDETHRGYNFVIKLCCTAQITCNYRIHEAIVMDTVGKSLYDLIQEASFRGINVDTVKSIMRQILLGLTYIHEACGLIHTDLKPDNIIIKGSERYLNDMFEKVLRYQELGKLFPNSYVTTADYNEKRLVDGHEFADEQEMPVYRRRRATGEATTSLSRRMELGATFNKPLLVSPNIHVQISDLGNAVERKDENNGIIQTPLYRSLEIYLEQKFDYSADIWSVGCILYEMVTAQVLFHPGKSQMSSHDHVQLIHKLLNGAIPMHIRTNGKYASEYFHPDGSLKVTDLMGDLSTPMDILVNTMGWSVQQVEDFRCLITACINPDPKDRATASKLLQHEWLTEHDTP